MADRAKNYAKNVKEMYMPRGGGPTNKYSELPEYLPPVGEESGGNAGGANQYRHFRPANDNNGSGDAGFIDPSVLKPPMPIKYTRPNLNVAMGDDTSYRGGGFTDSAMSGGDQPAYYF